MAKLFFILIFLIITFSSCSNSVEPFNYDRDTPVWLKAKIDSISVNKDYFGTKVYRYEWNNNYVYDIMVPISSCAYCELYYQDGNKINFTSDEMFSNFLENKKNEILIWEWDY